MRNHITDVFNKLCDSKKEIYKLTALNAVAVGEFANKKGLIDQVDFDEFRSNLERWSDGPNYRNWFNVFPKGTLKLNDKSFKKIKDSINSGSPEIPINKINSVYKNIFHDYLPAEILHAISSINSTSRIMTEAFNIKAHGDIDAGLLILVSANIIRLIETSPNDVLSDIGADEISRLKELAGEIFAKKLNFKSIYFPSEEYDGDSLEEVTESEPKDTNALSSEAEPKTKIGGNTLGLSRDGKLFSKLKDINRKIEDQSSYDQKVVIRQFEDLGARQSEVQSLLKKQASVFSSAFQTIIEKLENVADVSKAESDGLKSIKVFIEELARSRIDIEDDEANYLDVDIVTDEDSYALDRSGIPINSSQARDKLLQIRNEIINESPEIKNWENILQSPIVDAMLENAVNTMEEWKKVPIIARKYSENKKIMNEQLEMYWSRISPILGRMSSSKKSAVSSLDIGIKH